MAGIYIHIPFCKQACHYCNFHFSTSIRRKNELIAALLSEIALRQSYLGKEVIETIYLGGGTPSLFEIKECESIIEKLRSTFEIGDDAEITIEVNPDDIITGKLQEWKNIGINRISIGIQSFYEEDLAWMNRAHDAKQAIDCLELTRKYFNNITIDLIYGTPHLTNEKWKHNVDTAIAYNIPHLSCYALTVEPRTPLQKLIREQKTPDVDTDRQAHQFLLLMDWLGEAGYEHYEISNFSKPGFRSRHNSSYWQGKKYAGFGPSAHSFNGVSRQWNTSNNNLYIGSVNNGIIQFEKEELTAIQQLNEYIMISLRTIEGMDMQKISETACRKLQAATKKYIDKGWVIEENNHLKLTRTGFLWADGIAADLFFTEGHCGFKYKLRAAG